MRNPYGEAGASERIVSVLRSHPLGWHGEEAFYDLPEHRGAASREPPGQQGRVPGQVCAERASCPASATLQETIRNLDDTGVQIALVVSATGCCWAR